jgi:hypothetical protein
MLRAMIVVLIVFAFSIAVVCVLLKGAVTVKEHRAKRRALDQRS